MSAVMATFSSLGASLVMGCSVPVTWVTVFRSSAEESMAWGAEQRGGSRVGSSSRGTRRCVGEQAGLQARRCAEGRQGARDGGNQWM
jgi:hypothetical protein